MSTTQTTEQILVTGSLLSITLFQQKLMRNFFLINNKLKKLEGYSQLEARVRGLEKQLKFSNIKVQSLAQKLPKDGGSINRSDVKTITKQQIFDIFNNSDDKLTNSKFIIDLKKQISKLIDQLTRNNKKQQYLNNSSLISDNQQKNQILNQNKLSLTAGQILMNQGQIKKLPKQSLQQCLDKNQINMVYDIMGDGNNFMQETNDKIQDLYRKLQQLRIGKSLADYAQRQIQKFQKYQHYQQKSQQKKRSQIKLQGIKKQNIKGQILKNDLYSQMQKAEVVKNQFSRQVISRKTYLSKGGSTQTNFKDDLRRADNIKIIQEQAQNDQKIIRSKSTKRLDRIQRRLKVDDIKQLNSVLRQIQLRIQGKVSHEIFMGFVQDFQQKLQILKITKDTTNQLNDLRKMVYNIQGRLQSIITYLQNSQNQDQALIVKKQWTCVSCDKNLQKYGGKIGQHLNWDLLNSKKLSPTKAGAFGQTAQLATKIRNLMQNQKAQE